MTGGLSEAPGRISTLGLPALHRRSLGLVKRGTKAFPSFLLTVHFQSSSAANPHPEDADAFFTGIGR